jgi:hypothetical protein
MRKLTITFIVAICAAACAKQSQPQVKRKDDSCCTVTTTTVDKKTGAKKVVIEKHYGPIPDCTEPLTYTPCKGTIKPRPSAQPAEEPRKLTPAIGGTGEWK